MLSNLFSSSLTMPAILAKALTIGNFFRLI
jgi:hypothetical protein